MPVSPEDQAVLKDAIAYNAKHAGGSRTIKYKDMEILAPVSDIVQILELLGEKSHHERNVIIKSVVKTMDAALPNLQNRTADQDEFMGFCQDSVVWFAYQILVGKETLTLN